MARFRVGIMDFNLVSRPTPESLTRATYLNALANRVDSLWVPDHLNGLFPRSLWKQKMRCNQATNPRCVHGAVDNARAPRRAQSSGRMSLGTSVTDTGRRNPAVTAQAAATLHLLTRGRAILGIGTGEREGNEPYGVDWSKPVARFEEAMATIRALWNSGGQLVNPTRLTSRCETRYLICRPIAVSGPRSGSQPTARACCVPRAATAMAISRASRTGPRITRNGWKSFGPPPPTPGATPMSIIPAVFFR